MGTLILIGAVLVMLWYIYSRPEVYLVYLIALLFVAGVAMVLCVGADICGPGWDNYIRTYVAVLILDSIGGMFGANSSLITMIKKNA